MRYRRANVAGATYFFTVNLAERQSSLLVEHIDALREALRRVRHAHPFRIEAMVVLPNHLHALWTLPADDADFATRWMLIKAGFARQIRPTESRSPSRAAKGERGIWQRRYWEHLIRDQDDLARHVDYIHFNPVKHGLAMRAVEWPYSSIHRYIRLGLLSAEWASDGSGEGRFAG
ncbi:REP-associated tyrosine transposase [Candidatus Accumulibacter aalborgensis]|nr:transposase [Candidatus Accumulibacter aalborgensis]